MLSVNANELPGASLRMGAQVPIATMTPQSFQYKDVGTSIDCHASSTADGRFRVGITIDDTSVIGDEANAQQGLAKGNPSFRSFRTSESLLLKDGQSQQFHDRDRQSDGRRREGRRDADSREVTRGCQRSAAAVSHRCPG